MIMKNRFFVIVVAALLAAGSLNAQAPQKEAAFKDGEYLEFAVNYKVGIVNTDVATIAFTTRERTLRGTRVFSTTATAKTISMYKWFFDLNDTYVSSLDARTLQPLDLTVDLREGGYRFSNHQVYDWNAMTVTSSFRNHNKSNTNTVATMPLQPGFADPIAAYFDLRSINSAELVVGKPIYLDIVLDDTVRRMAITFQGREEKMIRGTGRFKALKFKGQIITNTGESFKDGSEFTVWISDDSNKIPLYVETPIRVGSVRVRLTKYGSLKYPPGQL